MSIRRTIDAFERWRADGQDLVLATVIDTQGSTYSKSGYRMLLTASGTYEGLVSGGCLEGDLADHARDVLKTGRARTITYDMRDEADELWGLGAGCKGLIRILLQKIDSKNDYQPFTTIAMRILNGRAAACATVVESDADGLPPGACLISEQDTNECWNVPDRYVELLRKGCLQDTSGQVGLTRHDTDTGTVTVLCTPLVPVPRLLILGAGRDAEPVVSIASLLGWQVIVADHRAGQIEQGEFSAAHALCVVDPSQLTASLDLSQFSAVIVMSHHLDTDRKYLQQLAGSDIRYLGLLGPPARRERLLADLGDTVKELAPRLHGPSGLDIGADSPESIALSVVAEMHAALTGRHGGSLNAGKNRNTQ